MAKITWEDKVGVKPKTVRINQVQDDDMNEIKRVVNTNDDNALYQGDNTLKKITTVQVTPEFAININDGKVTSFVVADEIIQLNGTIKIIPNGITPVVGNALGYTDAEGTIGQIPITTGNINSVTAGTHLNNSGTARDPILNVRTSDFANPTSQTPIRSSRIANLHLNMQTAIGMLITGKKCRIGNVTDFSRIDYDTPYLVVRVSSQGDFFLVENDELPNLQGALDSVGNIVNISFYREGDTGSVYRFRGAYPNVIGGAIESPEGVPNNYQVFKTLNSAFLGSSNTNTSEYTLSINTLVSKEQRNSGEFIPVLQSADLDYTYTFAQGFYNISGGICNLYIRIGGIQTIEKGTTTTDNETFITGLPISSSPLLPVFSTLGEVMILKSDNTIDNVKALIPPNSSFIAFYNPLTRSENGTEFPFSSGDGEVLVQLSYPIQ